MSREFAIVGNGLVSRGVLVATINAIVALIVRLPAVKAHDKGKNHSTHRKLRSYEKIREGEPPGEPPCRKCLFQRGSAGASPSHNPCHLGRSRFIRCHVVSGSGWRQGWRYDRRSSSLASLSSTTDCFCASQVSVRPS